MSLRIAVATNGKKGLEDAVSEFFGRANTFTIIDKEDNEAKISKILLNPSIISYGFGVGRIVVKTLVDLEVNLVIAGRFGLGVSRQLEEQNIAKLTVSPGTKVAEAIKNVELR